jgi:hypothetical protein
VSEALRGGEGGARIDDAGAERERPGQIDQRDRHVHGPDDDELRSRCEHVDEQIDRLARLDGSGQARGERGEPRLGLLSRKPQERRRAEIPERRPPRPDQHLPSRRPAAGHDRPRHETLVVESAGERELDLVLGLERLDQDLDLAPAAQTDRPGAAGARPARRGPPRPPRPRRSRR